MEKNNLPIMDHLNDFLEYLDIEKGLSNKSQETYQRFLKKFFSWIKENELEKIKPHELNEDHIRKYRIFLSILLIFPKNKPDEAYCLYR